MPRQNNATRFSHVFARLDSSRVRLFDAAFSHRLFHIKTNIPVTVLLHAPGFCYSWSVQEKKVTSSRVKAVSYLDFFDVIVSRSGSFTPREKNTKTKKLAGCGIFCALGFFYSKKIFIKRNSFARWDSFYKNIYDGINATKLPYFARSPREKSINVTSSRDKALSDYVYVEVMFPDYRTFSCAMFLVRYGYFWLGIFTRYVTFSD